MSSIKACLTIVFFVLATHVSLSQDYVIKNTPILESILRTKGSIPLIHQYRPNQFLPIEDVRINDPFTINQILVKNNSGLYLLLNGTGQVYHATSYNSQRISFRRLDKTIHFGYNIGAINFSFQDTLYSFGGYGFWHNNGQLRYFTSNKDWGLKPIETEIPLQSHLFCFFPDQRELYYLNEVKYKTGKYFVCKLSLVNSTNSILGNIALPETLNYISIETPNGSIIRHNIQHIFDWSSNKKFKIDADKFRFLDYLPAVVYFYQDTIFYATAADGEVNKVPFSIKDIDKSSYEELYEPVDRRKNQMLVAAIAMSLLSILGIFTILRYRKRKAIKSSMANNDQSESQLLTNEQLGLLEFILQYSLKGIAITTEEVNTFLGLDKKPLDVKKRLRREIITKINVAYQSVHKTDQLLINRLRATSDKRYFTYQIDHDLATKFISKARPSARKG